MPFAVQLEGNRIVIVIVISLQLAECNAAAVFLDCNVIVQRVFIILAAALNGDLGICQPCQKALCRVVAALYRIQLCYIFVLVQRQRDIVFRVFQRV